MNTILDDQNAPDERVVSIPVSKLYTSMPWINIIVWIGVAVSGVMCLTAMWAIAKFWKKWVQFTNVNYNDEANLYMTLQDVNHYYWRSMKQYAIIVVMMLVGAILLTLCTRSLFRYKFQLNRLYATRLTSDLELSFAAQTQTLRYFAMFAIAMVGFVVLAIVLDF